MGDDNTRAHPAATMSEKTCLLGEFGQFDAPGGTLGRYRQTKKTKRLVEVPEDDTLNVTPKFKHTCPNPLDAQTPEHNKPFVHAILGNSLICDDPSNSPPAPPPTPTRSPKRSPRASKTTIPPPFHQIKDNSLVEKQRGHAVWRVALSDAFGPNEYATFSSKAAAINFSLLTPSVMLGSMPICEDELDVICDDLASVFDLDSFQFTIDQPIVEAVVPTEDEVEKAAPCDALLGCMEESVDDVSTAGAKVRKNLFKTAFVSAPIAPFGMTFGSRRLLYLDWENPKLARARRRSAFKLKSIEPIPSSI